MPMPSYVDSGAFSTGLVVSANAVSGLDVAVPTTIVVGNLLVCRAMHRPSANFALTDLKVVGSGVWTQAFADNGGGVRQFIWYKYATGGEATVQVQATGNAGVGNAMMKGVMHQYANVLNCGTATFMEAQGVDNGTSSDAVDVGITTTGLNRLAINYMAQNNAVSAAQNGFAGEAGGVWTLDHIAVTGNPAVMRAFSAPMAAAGTIDGGRVSDYANTARTIRGFAFAPCTPDVTPKVPQMLHHYIMLRA